MELFFKISAGILAGVAAYFLWTGNGDSAFVASVFGALSFFLSVRFQVVARNRAAEKSAEGGGRLTENPADKALADAQMTADTEPRTKDQV